MDDCLKSEAHELFRSQLQDWELARTNYSALCNVKVREFAYDRFNVKVQFNPARMVSTGAKINRDAIASRPCFLCKANRPSAQERVLWRSYELLVNPYPIFPEHYTIAHVTHRDQALLPYIGDMVDLARALPDMLVFYNGPHCGASAPDHMHFQAGTLDFLPITGDYARMRYDRKRLAKMGAYEIYSLKNYLRSVVCIESEKGDAVCAAFEWLYSILEPQDNEPMMNVCCCYVEGKWLLFIFPRRAFRPWQYEAEGEKQLLVSPATVEMGGIMVVPVEEHFNRINREDIISIYSQVSAII